MARPDGLLDDETIVALIRVRFSGGMAQNIDSAAKPSSMYRQTVVQRHAYASWVRAAGAAGFPIAGPEMILGITQTRLLVWRPAMIRSRPRRFAGALPLTEIRSAGVHRRIFVSVLTLLLEKGTIVAVETSRGSHLRRFAASIPTFTDYKSR